MKGIYRKIYKRISLKVSHLKVLQSANDGGCISKNNIVPNQHETFEFLALVHRTVESFEVPKV